MSGMLDMLGDTAADASNDGARSTAAQDPDAVLTGAGGRVGGGEGRGGGGGRYSELIPHLLELVAYQSGVDTVEVCVCVRACVAFLQTPGVT